MKKILAAFLGIALAAACQLSYAAAAVVTAVTGTVQATGTGATRTLRVGDTLDEGDTVVTLAGSSAVFRFEDGHIAAPHANTRFVVSTYKYNRAQPAQNNVFLSLVVGTLRTITGLVGRQQPDNVAYRAGTATIGIRGTDVLLTVNADVNRTFLRVTDGEISVITRSATGTETRISLNANAEINAAIITSAGTQTGAFATMLNNLTPGERAAVNAIINDAELGVQITRAANSTTGGSSVTNPGDIKPAATSPN